MLAAGCSIGWPSPSLPKFYAADSPITITRDEGSWIIAMSKLAGILSPIPSAWMMDR